MRPRRPVRPTLTAIVLLGIATALAHESATAMSLRQLQQRLHSTSQHIRQVQSQLRTTKQRQQSTTKQVVIAQRRLGVHWAKLSDIRTELERTRAALAKAKSELATVEARLDRRNELLSTRLADIYKHGSISYANVLLGSEDMWDLLSRGYVLQRVLDADLRLVESIKKDRQAVVRYKSALQQKERQRAVLESQQATITQAALRDTRQKQALLEQVNRDRAIYEQVLAEEQQASAGLEARIRAMQHTPAGQKRVARPWGGKYICPITARYTISSRFGPRVHPIYRYHGFHTGVDLAVPAGTPILAAADGVVTHAGLLDHIYGNTVVIDHGGRMSTVYAHCSQVLVSRGQSVKQGRVIAKVGKSGWSTGPHLHYEFRKNGSAQNPPL